MRLVTILVEDNPTIRASLVPAMAEFANVEVVATAETAAQGIAAMTAHEGGWNLAIVDMFLKEGNGLEVLHAAKQRGSHQHVLVLTNYATADIRQRSLAAGADAVFDKSTEIDQFLERCRSYSEE